MYSNSRGGPPSCPHHVRGGRENGKGAPGACRTEAYGARGALMREARSAVSGPAGAVSRRGQPFLMRFVSSVTWL